jgi:hypothetical protein
MATEGGEIVWLIDISPVGRESLDRVRNVCHLKEKNFPTVVDLKEVSLMERLRERKKWGQKLERSREIVFALV